MNERLLFLREKTSKLTTSPGVYLMKDTKGGIIYIGKAKNLKNRVTGYFRETPDHTPKVAKMVSLVYDYDFIVTDTEYEALVLECSLIKQHKPKYNILLKDDKGYHYIKVSREQFPRITAEMQLTKDGEFLGPYTSGFVTRQAVNEVNRAFKLPTCKKKFPLEFRRHRPCLNFYIKQCMGVCTGKIPEDEYNSIIKQSISYIKNGSVQSVETLTKEMNDAAENLDFERAAKLRDRISAITKASDSQKIFAEGLINADIIASTKNNESSCISVLIYRNGKLFDKESFFFDEYSDENILEPFISQYYSIRDDIPKIILVDEDFEGMSLAEELLREKCNHAVRISCPQKGNFLKYTMMAKSNASEYLSLKVGRTSKELVALEELAKLLGLDKPPLYIEAYDISNLASTAMVAGMVVFENGRPQKKNYKKFSIKTVDIQNDYACMREVLERRFRRYLSDNDRDEGFSRMPDLIFVDGGKGQVNAVEPALRELGVTCPIFGIVKDNKHRTRAIATGGEEISVSSSKSAFFLLTRIQDEVHRFSISFQRTKHKKNSYQLELTSVKGIGEKKAMKLISSFKTREKLCEATVEEIGKIAGVNLETATELYNVIHSANRRF